MQTAASRGPPTEASGEVTCDADDLRKLVRVAGRGVAMLVGESASERLALPGEDVTSPGLVGGKFRFPFA